MYNGKLVCEKRYDMFFIICSVITPILFAIYNIVYYLKKKVIYTIKNENFVIVSNNYFKVQLFLSCVNSILISIEAYTWYKFNSQKYFLLFILTFWGLTI